MLAEFGTLSLKEVLAPAMEMAEGYAMERETADSIEGDKEQIKKWPYSRKILLPHPGESREAPYPGEIFRQPDLLLTLKKLVAAEQQALQNGKIAKRRSTPPMIVFTAAISPANSSAAARNRAA